MNIIVHLLGDDYMIGAEIDEGQSSFAYWHPVGTDDVCSIETWKVAPSMVVIYTSQGTGWQYFSDGYLAYRQLREYGTLLRSIIH